MPHKVNSSYPRHAILFYTLNRTYQFNEQQAGTPIKHSAQMQQALSPPSMQSTRTMDKGIILCTIETASLMQCTVTRRDDKINPDVSME